MRILALEPYYGGSHKAFIDGWSAVSRHEWTVLTLPPHKWKWRMRHSAVTFADEVGQRAAKGRTWDVVFCSDMLNLAEFLGLVPHSVQRLPTIVYFHENQLTYPVRFESERDYQFAMTNMTSALAAKSVWFNSVFHRDSFLDALEVFLRRMPDCQPTEAAACIRRKAIVHPPGVGEICRRGDRKAGPVRILWAARWEHDKDPESFFEALKILKSRGVKFRASVIGEQFREAPEVFRWGREYFAEHIDRWGYQQDKAQYEEALAQTDIFVSTAKHEFFGISAVEACLAGAYPLLPKRLAYPEILQLDQAKGMEEFFYDGSAAQLADRLTTLADRAKAGSLWGEDAERVMRLMERFTWNNRAVLLDEAVDKVRLS
jgi:glycosyltransferase involved in cell wall biosynthesis